MERIRLSSALDVPSYAFGLRRRSPHTSNNQRPLYKEPTMSRTIYRALLRLTAPEEFENKSNDDNDNE